MKQIDWNQHEDAMSLKEELNSILEGNQLFKGVIWLHPRMIGSKEELDSNGDIWLQHALIFSGAIKSRLATEGPILYVAQGSGNLGSSQNGSFQIAQSLSALAKTVQAEWVATHGRFIDLHKDFESAKFAELVWQEWNDPNLSRNQVGWDQNLQRWEYERVLHIPQLSQQELPLSSRVWLVSGGAKGVTSDCLLALAKLSPDTFILLGRTILEDEPAWASEVPDKDLKEAFLN
ncbi:MAG: hypothetical protein ACO20P_12305, partial [bacterium]